MTPQQYRDIPYARAALASADYAVWAQAWRPS